MPGKDRIRAEIAYYFSRLSTASFIKPIYPIYLSSFGISISLIVMISNLYTVVAVVLAPLVAYYVADRISRKSSWLIALTLFMVGLSVYIYSRDIWHVVLAELVYNLGAAFRASNPEVLTYTALKSSKVDDLEVRRIMINGEIISRVSVVAFAVMGGFLAGIDLRLPFGASILVLFLMFLLSLLLMQDVRDSSKSRSAETTSLIFRSISMLLTTKSVIRRFLGALIAVSLVNSVIETIVILKLRNIGCTAALIGFVYAITSLAASLTYYLARNRGMHSDSIIFLALVASTLPLIALMNNFYTLIIVLISNNILLLIIRPTVFVILQRYISENIRSTLNAAISSMVNAVLYVYSLAVGISGLTDSQILMLTALLALAHLALFYMLSIRELEFAVGRLSSAIASPCRCFPIIEANASNRAFEVAPEPRIRGLKTAISLLLDIISRLQNSPKYINLSKQKWFHHGTITVILLTP